MVNNSLCALWNNRCNNVAITVNRYPGIFDNTNTNTGTDINVKVIEDIIIKGTVKFNETDAKQLGGQLVGDHWSRANSWAARDIVRYQYYHKLCF